MFKFFDQAQAGVVDCVTFNRVLEKAGLHYPPQLVNMLFSVYAYNGVVDYMQASHSILG